MLSIFSLPLGHLHTFFGEMSCAHFLIGLFVFLILSSTCCLCISVINLLSFDSFTNIFFPSWVLSFPVFMVFFAVQKLLHLIRSHLFIIVFIFITLGGGSEKILLWFMSRSAFPMFSSKSHISCFSFILSLFLCMVLGSVLISFFYMQLPSFPSTTYWRDSVSPFYVLASFVID